MKRIKVLIIDDEHLAREIIRSFLQEDDSMEIVGECSNGFEGLKAIQKLNPDLVFLDVMMPKLTGFEMLELLENPPFIIFSTAFDEYAIKAFEKCAIDYLLKPYSKERLKESLRKTKVAISQNESQDQKIQSLSRNVDQKQESLTRVVIKNGAKINIISIDKIRYIEAMDDYVRLYTKEGDFLKQNTMKYYEKSLPVSDFVRIHRSFIVRIKEIARLEAFEKDTYVALLHDSTQLSVSRSGYSRLKQVLGI
ncbi:response regulator [Reichenbachiella sp. MALMAid0571]|uniref:LytR/AlgR family response regulator transcription factor n=1 Tax=Reichenbachiella sp. MALMAid0571 TaxID=3143939 RepID=UPI0032DE636C